MVDVSLFPHKHSDQIRQLRVDIHSRKQTEEKKLYESATTSDKIQEREPVKIIAYKRDFLGYF